MIFWRLLSICSLGSQLPLSISLNMALCWAYMVKGPFDGIGRYAVTTHSLLLFAPLYNCHTQRPNPCLSSPCAYSLTIASPQLIWAVPPYCQIDLIRRFSVLLYAKVDLCWPSAHHWLTHSWNWRCFFTLGGYCCKSQLRGSHPTVCSF